MSEHHELPVSPETCHWGFFDATLPPVLTVQPGDTVTIDTVNGARESLPPPPFEALEAHRRILEAMQPRLGPHILTGPVAIAGAEPGDVVEVRIETIQCLQNYGWTTIRPLMGSLPEDFPVLRRFHTAIDRQRGIATLPWGVELPLAPFFGVMGVAPPPVYGAVSSIAPREFGGNIDCKELIAGTSLFLPVWAPGGLFSCGDGHGRQGDGEVCITALETALRGTFRFILHKELNAKLPRAETPTHHITLGFNEDLDDAAKTALREMIRLIGAKSGLPAEEAYMLCSLAADLHVTQLVNGHKGIHAMLAKTALGQGAS